MNKNSRSTLSDSAQSSPHDATCGFGFEEMLTELEAIVAEAEIRLAEEEASA
ncbi:hypothetical protein GA0061071_11561 [Kosakonia oryzendophytica]|uniref:Uncharacterized protein n=1 Tax=Kosakonia oryzendophytica TaxID=1005665 RepID=A0A1C4DXV0_9ENTR|nr:hypothetical protein [Kosakonia oryzendophytica]AMO47063.1 Hypothetical protein AKI40_0640 [Enterobacter sp. FY-07]TDT56650.1 hypothetical protein DFO53_2659 [Enterobacter sp. AG5470]SCC36178.1 hypothetical protein GA0061071_11561 [Kosakonia oryzendophytica]